jgi:hypothetical protein
LNVHQVAPRQPILLAIFTIDVDGDALAKAGIFGLLNSRWSVASWLLRLRANYVPIQSAIVCIEAVP